MVPTLPSNYDPWSEVTPEAVYNPTDTPRPSTPTAQGAIYDPSLEDRPEGKMLGEVNYWVGDVEGLRTEVFAGHAINTPSQGFIIVETPITGTVTVDGPTRKIDSYPTPTQAGAVRFINEVSGRFTLQAADGSYCYFDINTRLWVNP